MYLCVCVCASTSACEVMHLAENDYEFQHFVNAHYFDPCLMICNKKVLRKTQISSLSLSVVHFNA